jgi:hypothetical protein
LRSNRALIRRRDTLRRTWVKSLVDLLFKLHVPDHRRSL